MHYLKKLENLLQSKLFYFFLFLFIIFYIGISHLKKPKIDISSTQFQGIIEDYKIDGDKLTLQVKGLERIIATYYIKEKTEWENLRKNIKVGLTINLLGVFETPSKNTIPNLFNYKKYLKSKKIDLIMNTQEYKIIKKENIFYQLKNKIQDIIQKRKNSKYYFTFILGNKNYLETDVYNSFKINGITHLLAISGMHISMFILLLKKCKISNLCIMIFLLFYSFLVLFTPSVLRVTLFYILKNIPLFKNVKNTQLLFLTAFLLLLYNPFLIYDVGFQYSFLITFGLFLFPPKNLFCLSFDAFLFSLPITLYNNFEFNILSVFINILIVPFVSNILYPFLLLTFLLPFLEPILTLLLFLLENVNLFFQNYAIMIITGKIPVLCILFYYFFLFFFKKYENKKMLLFLILIIVITKYKYLMDLNGYVYYLDVGQGDCTAIITPLKKEVIMIDTGGIIQYERKDWQKRRKNYKQSDTLILFLKSLGITHLDFLILSHGDYDHMGNSVNLVNDFRVDKVVFNNDSYNNLEKELIKVLESKNIKYYKDLDVLNTNKNKFYFLNTKRYDNENDNSNVIYTELNNYKFLFMGDASTIIEKEILNKYKLSNIDVLKVGHHGSKTSSSEVFVDTINPGYSIISVGKNNRYGHPNKEVLNNLKDSKIYRTDINGSIMFKIKNSKLKIETCSPQKGEI